MSQNAHLTFKQFCEKHREKFNSEGLTRKQRGDRYQSYLASYRNVDSNGVSYGLDHRGNRTSLEEGGSVSSTAARRSRMSAGANGQSTNASRSGGTGHVANIRRLLTGDPLVRAMLAPFDLQGDQVPKIPDGLVAHTCTALFKQNVDIYSTASGRCAFFLRNTPWASIAVSNALSDVIGGSSPPGGDDKYMGSFEYNAYAAEVGRATQGLAFEPRWTENAWSIPVIATAVASAQDPAFTLQDQINAQALYATASAWRPVCCGYRFKYTAPVLSGSGEMAVARWPGTYGVPTQANRALYMQNEDPNPQVIDVGVGGPNFTTVQALPGAKVYSAVQGHTAVWCPNGLETQKVWRPVKPLPIQTATNSEGELAVSAYATTLLLVRPPPCTGDPARMKSLIDMLYNLNLSVQCMSNNGYWGTYWDSAGNPAEPYGQGQGLLYQPTPYNATTGEFEGAVFATDTMYAARDLLNGMEMTDMMEGDTALIMVGEGLPPSTLIGTIEIVSGFEYIPDTRVLQLGGGVKASPLQIKPSRQLDMHAAAITAVQAAPTSVAGSENGFGAFVDSVVRGAESVFNGGMKIGGLVAQAAPFIESLGALLL